MPSHISFKRAISRVAIASVAAISILNSCSTTARAQEIFDNNGIRFEVDTIVEFEFLESNGAYQSSFGVINLETGEKNPLLVEVKPSDRFQTVNKPSDYRDDAGSGGQNDFKGTPGNAVPQSLVAFEFKANTPYVFYLESSFNGRSVGILYSINQENPGSNQQVEFQGNLLDLGEGGVILRWDDTGSALVRDNEQDSDFDDFVIGIGGHLNCPFDSQDAISEFSINISNQQTITNNQ